MEFSKKIFIINTIIVSLITLWGMILFTHALLSSSDIDFSPIITLFGVVYTEYGTSTAFYYNKAKLENKLKIMKENKISLEKEDVINDL